LSLGLATAATVTPPAQAQGSAWALLKEAAPEIQEMLDSESAVGAAIVVINGGDTAIGTYGHMTTDRVRPITGYTLFEIGSMTKLFTGLLLIDAVERGEVALDTTIGELLPPRVVTDMGPARDITLLSLATNLSGLPRNVIQMPGNPTPNEYSTAIGSARAEDVYEFLKTFDPRPTAGQWQYSNGGFELLGHVLELKTGKTFAELLRQRITTRMGMTNTMVHMPTSAENETVPEGYVWFGPNDLHQQPERGDNGYFANSFSPASGEIVSTASDMLLYANALLRADHLSTDRWSQTLARSMAPYSRPSNLSSSRSESGRRIYSAALGWNIETYDDHVILIKDGQTYQFQSYIVISPTKNRAVIVLTNTAGNFGAGSMAPVVWKIMDGD